MKDDAREKNTKRVSEKVKEFGVDKEKGYLYFIDEDGDVARVPAKWNRDPRFLERVEGDEQEVEKRFMQAQQNYPKKEEKHEEPIPATTSGTPQFFMDKKIFYTDKTVIGIIGEKAISPTHIRIYTKEEQNFHSLKEAPLVQAMTVASFASSMLYEALKAQGTNIILNEEDKRLCVSVIQRSQDDGLNLMWEIKQGDKNQVAKAAQKLRDALIIGEKKNHNVVNMDKEPNLDPNKKVNIVDYNKIEEDSNKGPVNYMIEHLQRTN